MTVAITRLNACDLIGLVTLSFPAHQVLQVFSLPGDALALASTHSFDLDLPHLGVDSYVSESQGE